MLRVRVEHRDLCDWCILTIIFTSNKNTTSSFVLASTSAVAIASTAACDFERRHQMIHSTTNHQQKVNYFKIIILIHKLIIINFRTKHTNTATTNGFESISI